jgi:hypothetical protein
MVDTVVANETARNMSRPSAQVAATNESNCISANTRMPESNETPSALFRWLHINNGFIDVAAAVPPPVALVVVVVPYSNGIFLVRPAGG